MRFIQIRLFADNLGVMVKPDAAGLIVINDPALFSDKLRKPDRGAIGHAQIPCGNDRNARLMRNTADTAFCFGLAHFLAVISADDCGLKAAFKLLIVSIRPHGL